MGTFPNMATSIRMNEIGSSAVSDQQVIDQTLGGETEAFGHLVRKYQQRLYNSLVHMLRDEAEAEDATQEAFVLALTKLDSFKGQSAFFTWLYRIGFNAAISRMRKKRPSLSIQQDLSETAGMIPGVDSRPDQKICREEDVELVNKALGLLPEQHRAILVLREIDGCSYEEISEVLKLPIGTVRSRLHRARSQLKQEIEMLLGRNSSADGVG